MHAVILAALVSPASALAQANVVVEGRVYDLVTNGPVPNAVVTLEGHGSVLSNKQGMFRFTTVVRGAYLVRVEAFGYEQFVGNLPVTDDVTIALPLRAGPLQLDSVLVEAETVDFDGRVRDPGRDYFVMDSHVLSTQGHEELSDAGGRFDLDDVWAGARLRLLIRSFGYLPLDTTFIPDGEERRVFDLVPDPVIEKLIEAQNQRLEARAGEAKYPLSVLRRVVCVVVDERQVRSRDEVRFVLQNTVPETLERVELLELRAYTRTFFQQLIARNQPLQRPGITVDAVGYKCN